ncbi:MAG: AAA family ATPase, partial [Gemmatimonadales bacterium]
VPGIPYLSVLPATQDLVGAELQLVERPFRESALRRVLEPLERDYDYIVVDCPPSLGLLTLNVLAAVRSLIIPIQCEYYGLEGISQLLNTVRLVQQNINPGLAIAGVLLTMYDSRLNLCRQVAEDATEYFGPKVFGTPIPRNVRLAEAPSFGKPILLYDVQSVGAKSYLAVGQELLLRIEGANAPVMPTAVPTHGQAPVPEESREPAETDAQTEDVQRERVSSPDEESAVAESKAIQPADARSAAVQFTDGQSTDERSMDGQSADGRRADGQAYGPSAQGTDVQSADRQSAHEQSAHEQSAHGQLAHVQSPDGKSPQVQSAVQPAELEPAGSRAADAQPIDLAPADVDAAKEPVSRTRAAESHVAGSEIADAGSIEPPVSVNTGDGEVRGTEDLAAESDTGRQANQSMPASQPQPEVTT